MTNVMLGTSYYPDHWPRGEWRKDLQLIKDSGLECVRFGEFSWTWFEEAEGVFDFGRLDTFMDIADDVGLKIVLCTPTAAPPAWFFEQHPDATMLDQRGLAHDYGRHSACFNHPEFRRAARRTITELARHVQGHPALDAWQLDNEPTMGESADPQRMYDYSPWTSRLFGAAVEERFGGDLDALNIAWHNGFWSHTYTSWSQVKPPVRPGNPSLWLEWMRFRRANVVDFLQWQLGILRAVSPDAVVGTNIPECGPVSSAILGQDYWGQAEGMDYVGTDIYCFRADPAEEMRSIGYSCDIVRSVAESHAIPWWISETQGGPHLSPWRFDFCDGVWGADFLARTTEAYVEHGAERALFFLWRPVPGGREFGMNGMVDLDGSATERSAAIASLPRAARAGGGARPQAFVHYSEDSLVLSVGFDPDRTADASYRGWHALLDDCGYRVTFLNDDALEAQRFQEGDRLVLPYTMVMGEHVAAGVRRAAEQSATILAGFATGFYDDHGACSITMPGMGLDATFGYRLVAIDHVSSDRQHTVTIGGGDVGIGPRRGLIRLRGAEAVAMSDQGAPLVVRIGHRYHVTFDAGALYETRGHDAELLRWLRSVLALGAPSGTSVGSSSSSGASAAN